MGQIQLETQEQHCGGTLNQLFTNELTKYKKILLVFKQYFFLFYKQILF